MDERLRFVIDKQDDQGSQEILLVEPAELIEDVEMKKTVPSKPSDLTACSIDLLFSMTSLLSQQLG